MLLELRLMRLGYASLKSTFMIELIFSKIIARDLHALDMYKLFF